MHQLSYEGIQDAEIGLVDGFELIEELRVGDQALVVAVQAVLPGEGDSLDSVPGHPVDEPCQGYVEEQGGDADQDVDLARGGGGVRAEQAHHRSDDHFQLDCSEEAVEVAQAQDVVGLFQGSFEE